MARKLGWGVLGATGIADRRTIPEGILPARNARLIAVQSRDPERARALAAKYGAVASYVNDLDLIRDPRVEAVYVATPVDRHLEQVLACAKEGKHVLVEKPMGLSVKEAERMVAACRKAKVKFGVGFMMRFHSAHHQIAGLLRDGALGTPVMARAQLLCWYPPMKNNWRQDPKRGGGGAVMDLSSHCIDLLAMFFGKIKSITALTGTLVHKYKVDDSSAVLLEFASGAMGVVDCHFSVPDAASVSDLELYGSSGAIRATQTIGQGAGGTLRAYLEGKGKKYDAKRANIVAAWKDLPFTPENMYKGQIEAFSDAVLLGKTPSVSGEVGLQSQRHLDAVYRSAKTGRKIKV